MTLTLISTFAASVTLGYTSDVLFLHITITQILLAKATSSVEVNVVTYCITAGAGHSSSMQVPDRILWSAARLCTDGRHRVSVLAPDQRYLSDRQLLHGPQTARELRMLLQTFDT